MRKLIAFLFLCSLSSFAQEDPVSVDVSWGEEIRASSKATLNDIVGYDETGIYALVSERKSFTRYGARITLEKYDSQLKRQQELKIDLREGNKTVYLEKIVQLKDRLYLFSSYNDQKTKKNKLLVQTVNKKELVLNEDRKVVADIGYKNQRNDGNFGQKLSLDSSKLLIWYDLPYKLRQPERFGLKVFDDNFNLLWAKDIQLPYSDELFEVKSYKVDGRGNVFILGRVFKDKLRVRKGGLPNYKYHVLAYFNKGTQIKEYTLSFQDKYITDAQFEITHEGDLICTGFYSDRGTSSIKGTYFLRIDGETKKMKNINYKEFEPRVLAEFISERRAAKKRELYQFDLRELILRKDGSIIMIAEQFFVTSYTARDPITGSTRTTNKFNYKDLIVVNVGSNGSIKWIRKIAKRQTTTDDGGFYSSFAVAYRGDDIYLVFNDTPRNLNVSDNRRIYNFTGGKESIAVLVKLDSEGRMLKETLFNVRDAEVITRPKVSEQVDYNTMIIYGQRKKNHRLVKLNLK